MPSFLNERLIIFHVQVVVMQNLWEGRTVSMVFDLKVLIEAAQHNTHNTEPLIVYYPLTLTRTSILIYIQTFKGEQP